MSSITQKSISLSNRDGVFTDEHGELWIQETAKSWRRETDGLYWVGDPTTIDNIYGRIAPTVEEALTIKSRYIHIH